MTELQNARAQMGQHIVVITALIRRHGGEITLTQAELNAAAAHPAFHVGMDVEHGIMHLALQPPAAPAPAAAATEPAVDLDKKPRSRVLITPDGETQDLPVD